MSFSQTWCPMTKLSRGLILTLAVVCVGVGARTASAAVFTVNIFNLKNQLRAGQTVTVIVAAVDADGNVVTDPHVNFDGDRDAAGTPVISTQKDVTAGRAVVTVDDARVSSVTLTFTGAGLRTTADQRFRNVANLNYDVAVPDDLTPPLYVQCPPCCVERDQARFRWFPRLFRR